VSDERGVIVNSVFYYVFYVIVNSVYDKDLHTHTM
jgi:hypothetical protein